ncbi:adenosine deaminase [Acrocarpospora sp. B8E8]|uniref:adenosine deaminase n=1 Tax=Acrocarpospora sp. B8E8 TaxID=3153572 RepID=UPI00325E696A
MLLNLHTHLEGCLRPETAADLAKAAGLPEPDVGWEAALRMRERADLTVFLAHVAAAYPVLAHLDGIARAAREAVEDAAADGASFVELRVGPSTHAGPGRSIYEVLNAVCEGVASAPIPAGVVACLLRHVPEHVNMEVANAACQLAGVGVVGLDVAGDELLFPALEPYVAAFAMARSHGLGVTAHAGEAAPGHAVREAVDLLGVSRIGHGSRAADDSQLLEWAADEGVCFEVCPTSNVLTGAAPSLAEHPMHRFLAAGCRVVLGDDDPITTGVRLASEVRALVSEGGLPPAALDGMARTAVEVAFCHDGVRAELRHALEGIRAED